MQKNEHEHERARYNCCSSKRAASCQHENERERYNCCSSKRAAGFLLVASCIICLCLFPVKTWLINFAAWGAAHKMESALIINGIYLIFPLLFIPTGYCMLAAGRCNIEKIAQKIRRLCFAGYVFGWWGLLVIQPGYNIGSWLGFLAGRYLFQDCVARCGATNKCECNVAET